MMTINATAEALADLQWNWGGAYLITGMSKHWLAQRRDNGGRLKPAGRTGYAS